MICAQELTKGLSGAAVVASMIIISGLATIAVTGTPAQASCLIAGEMRNDIADNDCLEAQRTGCVRNSLTPDQYSSCLKANKEALESGKVCVVAGTIRNEFSPQDCEEAKATGCVRRLLTPNQYVACLGAQRH